MNRHPIRIHLRAAPWLAAAVLLATQSAEAQVFTPAPPPDAVVAVPIVPADRFRDSWFWGVKSGVVSFSTWEGPRATRGTYGAEWLITRTVGALYLHGDYAGFHAVGSIIDPAAEGGRRPVEFRNLRRVGFAALAFPRTFAFVRPYGGIGFEINVLGRAEPVMEEEEEPVSPAVLNRIEDARSRSVVSGIAGAQVQFGRAAAFGQVTLQPPTRRFLIEDRSVSLFELGVRYNIGTSRDRLDRVR